MCGQERLWRLLPTTRAWREAARLGVRVRWVESGREAPDGPVDALVADAAPGWLERLAALRLLVWTGPWEDVPPARALPPAARIAEAGGHEAAMAEHAVGLVLALTRRTAAGLASGGAAVTEPDAAGISPGMELAGRTVSVLGLGRVGREVVRRLTPFDCDLVAVKRTPDGYLRELLGLMELAEAERLDVALDAADVLVVTCPLTSRTRGLLGRRELRRLRRTAYLVNVSRAEVVDEAALADALREEWIAGCALDVAYPPGGPLVGAPRLLRTPHLGPHAGAAVRRRAESVMDHLRALASGEPPPGERPRHPDAAGSEEEAT